MKSFIHQVKQQCKKVVSVTMPKDNAEKIEKSCSFIDSEKAFGILYIGFENE